MDVQAKPILLEWRCWACSRLIMRYVKGATGEWQHVCKCKAMNVLRLERN
jgi:hypothetical protein